MTRRVVVTGIGVVSPIGCGQEAFVSGLREAKPGIGTIRRFDASAFPTRIAGEVSALPPVVGVALPQDAAGLHRDPKARFALAAGREALGDAFGGETPPYPASRRALSLAGGLEIFHLEDLLPHLRAPRHGAIDGAGIIAALAEHAPGAALQIPADLAARNLAADIEAQGGYSLNVSACAAGGQAIGEASRAIRDGRAEMVLAGGYDSMVNPLGLAGFALLEAMSTKNELEGAASRPFDQRRDGFVLGEGAAMLVLEERDQALARGATLLGELRGYASTLDAFRVTDPAPDQRGAIAAMAGALDDGGLAPEDIGYVNAHGTGTRKNDPAETRALRAVFGAHVDHLPVSSTKSQIGHLIGAAGAVEAAATLLCLAAGFLPATINLEQIDAECLLDHVQGVPRRSAARWALSNSFGFGGQNASLIIGGPEAAHEGKGT